MSKKTKPHHHGNLREALITAGLEILEKSGVDALTLRKCAARAGVSHAAPAHHFNGLISLKAAVIARGHRMFAQSMQNTMEKAAPDAMAQLAAICQGYLSFAAEHRAVFQFMFQPHDVDFATISPWVMEDMQKETSASYGLLQQACAAFDSAKNAPNSTEITVWSLVHGYAMLFSAPETDSTPSGPVPDFSIILQNMGLRLRG